MMIKFFTAFIISLVFSTGAATAQDVEAPAKFAPQAAAEAILNICAKDGFSGNQTAVALGLKQTTADKGIAWALAADAQVWNVDSRDGEVLLFAYGPQQVRCGVIINFTVPFAGRYAVSRELHEMGDYEVFSESEISAGVHFIRMYNEDARRYIDIVDYPGSRSSPGLIKVELLAN